MLALFSLSSPLIVKTLNFLVSFWSLSSVCPSWFLDFYLRLLLPTFARMSISPLRLANFFFASALSFFLFPPLSFSSFFLKPLQISRLLSHFFFIVLLELLFIQKWLKHWLVLMVLVLLFVLLLFIGFRLPHCSSRISSSSSSMSIPDKIYNHIHLHPICISSMYGIINCVFHHHISLFILLQNHHPPKFFFTLIKLSHKPISLISPLLVLHFNLNWSPPFFSLTFLTLAIFWISKQQIDWLGGRLSLVEGGLGVIESRGENGGRMMKSEVRVRFWWICSLLLSDIRKE